MLKPFELKRNFLALLISNGHEGVLVAEIMAARNKTVLEKKV